MPSCVRNWGGGGEDPRPGNRKCKGPGAGKNQFTTQTGTTMADICPGRNDGTGIGRASICEETPWRLLSGGMTRDDSDKCVTGRKQETGLRRLLQGCQRMWP